METSHQGTQGTSSWFSFSSFACPKAEISVSKRYYSPLSPPSFPFITVDIDWYWHNLPPADIMWHLSDNIWHLPCTIRHLLTLFVIYLTLFHQPRLTNINQEKKYIYNEGLIQITQDKLISTNVNQEQPRSTKINQYQLI